MNLREITGIQQPVVEYAYSLGWVCWKMQIVGINGCPDFWFFRESRINPGQFNGDIVIIEFKAPEKPRRKNQIRRAEDLERSGRRVYVVDNVKVGCAIFDSFDI
jgi:hypothetical protein